MGILIPNANEKMPTVIDRTTEVHKMDLAEQIASLNARVTLLENLLNVAAAEQVSTGGGTILAAVEANCAIVRANKVALVNEIGCVVYDKVIDELNTKVLPRVNRAIDWMEYKTEDTDTLITSYRHAVTAQARQEEQLKTLTCEGMDTSHIISEHVSLFFPNN